MNYPVWELPAPGLLIAAVGILHVFISHFAVGGGLFLVLAETRARRQADLALLGFVRTLSRSFVLLTLVLGALSGVGIWFTIGLVQPQATSALVTVFVWAWAIEWTFFVVELAAALVYYHGWDRLEPATHLRVGWIYFVSALASLVVISGILSFMMSSGAWPLTRRFADAFFNPTFAPTVALRLFGAVGLTGLYVLAAASFVSDAQQRARIVRYAGFRWIAPAALAVPLALGWFLSAASRAGVAVAETLGAATASPLSILAALLAPLRSGQPIVRAAALAALAATVLLVAASLSLAAARPQRLGRPEAFALLFLGLVSIGASEWLREGLRKPWVIDRYMFVNGVRVPPPPTAPVRVPDPFALDALERSGVLAVSPWSATPASVRAGDPELDRLPADEQARLAAEAGRVLFAVECAICHTDRGHLGIRRLVSGRSLAAITAVLDTTARPLTPDGRPGAWSDAGVRVATWRGRRMPAFAGTAAEKRALAIHLARLGGDPRAGLVEPPFSGTDRERHALARYLGDLGAPPAPGEPGR